MFSSSREPPYALYSRLMRCKDRGEAMWDPSPDVMYDERGRRREDPVVQVGHVGYRQEGKWRHVLDIHRPWTEQRYPELVPQEGFQPLARRFVSSHEPEGPIHFTPKSRRHFAVETSVSSVGGIVTATGPSLQFSLDCDASLTYFGRSQRDQVRRADLGKYRRYAVHNLRYLAALVASNDWSLDVHELSIVTDRTLAPSWVTSVQAEKSSAAQLGASVYVNGVASAGFSLSFAAATASGLVTKYGPFARLATLPPPPEPSAARYFPPRDDDPAIAGPLDQCLFIKSVRAADRSLLEKSFGRLASPISFGGGGAGRSPQRERGSGRATRSSSTSQSVLSIGRSVLEGNSCGTPHTDFSDVFEFGDESDSQDWEAVYDPAVHAMQYILKESGVDVAVYHDDDIQSYMTDMGTCDDISTLFPRNKPRIYAYEFEGQTIGCLSELNFGTPIGPDTITPIGIILAALPQKRKKDRSASVSRANSAQPTSPAANRTELAALGGRDHAGSMSSLAPPTPSGMANFCSIPKHSHHRAVRSFSAPGRERPSAAPPPAVSPLTAFSPSLVSIASSHTPAAAFQPTPSAFSFVPPPLPYSYLTLDASQRTLNSAGLQAVVSAAVEESLREKTARLLAPASEMGMRKDAERIEQEWTVTVSAWRFETGRRDMILRGLKAALSGTNSDSGDGEAARALLAQLNGTLAKLGVASEALLRLSARRMQLQAARDMHRASALVIALRKLGEAYFRQTRRLDHERDRRRAVQDEADEAWRVAEDVAIEMERLRAADSIVVRAPDDIASCMEMLADGEGADTGPSGDVDSLSIDASVLQEPDPVTTIQSPQAGHRSDSTAGVARSPKLARLPVVDTSAALKSATADDDDTTHCTRMPAQRQDSSASHVYFLSATGVRRARTPESLMPLEVVAARRSWSSSYSFGFARQAASDKEAEIDTKGKREERSDNKGDGDSELMRPLSPTTQNILDLFAQDVAVRANLPNENVDDPGQLRSHELGTDPPGDDVDAVILTPLPIAAVSTMPLQSTSLRVGCKTTDGTDASDSGVDSVGDESALSTKIGSTQTAKEDLHPMPSSKSAQENSGRISRVASVRRGMGELLRTGFGMRDRQKGDSKSARNGDESESDMRKKQLALGARTLKFGHTRKRRGRIFEREESTNAAHTNNKRALSPYMDKV